MVNRNTNTSASIRDELERKLVELGMRKEGDFALHSGIKSNVFWEIEALFRHPLWMRREVLKPFIWGIGIYQPDLLVGIREGGYTLAKEIGECLGIKVLTEFFSCRGATCPRTILIDDVMSTGDTVEEYLEKSDSVIAVAVLVNRSGLVEISGLPVITGIYADRVYEVK